MEYGGIDLHLRHSLMRIVDAAGVVLIEQRIPTAAAEFQRVFRGRRPMRVLIETGTESEWVACAIEACGHTVVVADPNYALMYGQRQRRIKTDRRDVAALAEACRLGIYRVAHRVSAAQRDRRRRLRVREHWCGCGRRRSICCGRNCARRLSSRQRRCGDSPDPL